MAPAAAPPPPGPPLPIEDPPPPAAAIARGPRRLSRLGGGMGDRGTYAVLGITLSLLVAAGAVVSLTSNWNGIGQTVGPSCSFGVTGTAASITVRGWSSGDACKALRSGATFQTYDLPREATNQPVICDYPLANDLIVVHDQAAGAAGGTLCQALRDAFARPSPTP